MIRVLVFNKELINNLSTADPVLKLPFLVDKEMVEKSICKMKNDKTSDPSSVVTEMLKASSDVCSELIAELTNSIKMYYQLIQK